MSDVVRSRNILKLSANSAMRCTVPASPRRLHTTKHSQTCLVVCVDQILNGRLLWRLRDGSDSVAFLFSSTPVPTPHRGRPDRPDVPWRVPLRGTWKVSRSPQPRHRRREEDTAGDKGGGYGRRPSFSGVARCTAKLSQPDCHS